MSRDDDFRVRPGRIRPKSGTDPARALKQVRIAVSRAGGGSGVGATGRSGRPSTFGRGRVALARGRQPGTFRRQVVVKARVVRMASGALGAHIAYLQRDGVTREGEPGQLFDAGPDRADASAFRARAGDDRHHFRFIVAPEDAASLPDLRNYTRDLMTGVEADLETRLDWIAVDHWNTAHPHVHIVLRGALEDGADLVISRDYIARGLRARAEHLVELELGPPTPRERATALARHVETSGWTRLDNILERFADQDRIVGPGDGRLASDPALRTVVAGRIRTLERLGLAEAADAGRWRLDARLGERLRGLARETELAGRLETALRDKAIARSPEQYVAADLSSVVIGRVIARGVDDELRGSGFAVLDGMDGRVHHLTLPDAGAADPRVGAIVRASPSSRGRHAMTVTVSDLGLADQIRADGATWLDRRLLTPGAETNAGGFAAEAAAAGKARLDHLIANGLAERPAGPGNDRVRFVPGLLERLRSKELAEAAARIEARTGLGFVPTGEGDVVSGVYRQRVDLASGRFAMIDDGLGFSLVPWRLSMERELGRSLTGTMGPGGDLDWRPARTLGR